MRTHSRRPLDSTLAARHAMHVAMLVFALAAVLALSGCSSKGSSKNAGSNGQNGQNMAGPAQKVIVSRKALENAPSPFVLSSPEATVRSYLDWTSYAYRIAESRVATPTMSPAQGVRVDSYLQLNLEKSQLLDQTLDSITFGKASTGTTNTLLPATEHWTYRYVSIKEVDKTLRGPFKATYADTYVLVKQKNGDWLVDSVIVKPVSAIK
jgi:hypothetical protein